MNKRILTLFMTLVMLVTSVSVVSAENAEVTATAEAPVVLLDSGEFKALYAMGFLGDEMAETDKNAYITRAQFTGYLCKIAGYPVADYAASEIPFIDVNVDTLYCDEICTMYEMGRVNGTDPNMFSPDNHVTYAQACKLIIDVLGYRNYAEIKYGEFPEGYIMMAGELDINDGVKNVVWNSELTADDAVKMLYNAGRAEVFKFAGVDANGNPKYESDGTDLFATNDIFYGEGVMYSNGMVSLVEAEARDGITTIGDKEFVSADADLKELIGSRVKYFYKENKTDKKLLCAWEDTRFNSSIELKAIDLVTDSSEYTRTNIVYYEKDNKTENAKLKPLSYVIYNNELFTIPTLDMIKIDSGKMRLIDNDDDEVYDVVIIEEFKNMFVVGNPPESTFLVDKYNNSVELKDHNVVKIFKNGKEIDKSEIPAGVVVSYIQNPSKTIIYMYVIEQGYQATLNREKTYRGDKVYTFGDKEFKLAQSYKDIMTGGVNMFITPEIGKKYKFWLDMDGEIAEIQEADGNLQYALLVKAEKGPAYEEDTVYTRMIFTDGSDNKPVISKSLIFDGEKVPAKDLFDTSKPHYAKLFNDDGSIKEQVIMVSFHEDGIVKEIDIAEDNTLNPYGYDTSKFTVDINGSTTVSYSDGFRMINAKWLLDNTTLVFVKWTGDDNPEWTVSNQSAFSGTYDLMAYDTGSNLVPKIMYKKSQPKTSYWVEGFFIVDKIEWVVQDGEELKKISGYANGAYKSYTEFFRGALPDTVVEGDVIRVSHYNGKLSNIDYITNLTDDDEEPFFLGTFTGDNCSVFAPIYSIASTGVTVVTPEANVEAYGPIVSSGFVSGTFIVTVYDRETSEVTMADFNSIKQTVSPNADGTLPETENQIKILFRRRYGAIREAIIVK